MSELWIHGKYYTKGQYVYPTTPNGYYYVALNSGYAQSYNFGNSSKYEPSWVVNQDVYEDKLVWSFILADGTETTWKASKKYLIGNKVKPTTGNISWGGKSYCFYLKRILAEPDWPIVNKNLVIDNEVTWETHVSAYTFIPKGIIVEETLVETYIL